MSSARSTTVCRVALLLTICLMSSVRARAQEGPRTSAYVFGGVGQVTPDHVFTYWGGPTLGAGAGVEQHLAGNVLLVGEFEYLHRSTKADGVMLPSLNAGFAWGGPRLRPFITGGYTFVSGSAAFNYGGGATCWLQERFGLRFEFRDHLLIFDTPLHSYGVRVGVSIR